METMHREGQAEIPPWHAGTPGELVEGKAPHLEVPEGQAR
jgi:hypothetical protein